MIDFCLVVVVKRNLGQKLLNKKGLMKGDKSNSEVATRQFLKEEKKKTSVERKMNAMIIINLIIYTFCRLPELIGVFIIFFYHSIENDMPDCQFVLMCNLVSDSIEYLYMLSYIFNIFLYFKFTLYFHEGFLNFFVRKSAKN